MEVLIVIIPLALFFAGLGLWIFFRAVRKGQFDDLETPAHRMLLDDDVQGQQEKHLRKDK